MFLSLRRWIRRTCERMLGGGAISNQQPAGAALPRSAEN
jgi:hypothetical protein